MVAFRAEVALMKMDGVECEIGYRVCVHEESLVVSRHDNTVADYKAWSMKTSQHLLQIILPKGATYRASSSLSKMSRSANLPGVMLPIKWSSR
jgi:hypothetical protein